ncbi:Alcohol dehydrogenase GroES-like domain-containing protein [Streptomyces sp. 2224.1]|uniref:alcohol dehydrogenase catalytic domain-containing protein n=1 Tax=unclassified Streptomyces TaxID=2593676 RepID=UPI00088AB403|nr:alcohol dehydrogenase-like protein [Streptomyces sp. 2321.6]SDR53183.1 alcohol dehydrogenase, propanol-preferring [Streptomyces sp. KS_16]SEC30064.1 Alcohol dehydrogenase GroES-like domain-containing protein [Streptomyces sp. 2133.1]SEC71972.1 Alcohol dehydrogenase GroES-like domain-containing protein [Streptomyces sp. 2224.1]SNC66465.1 Alcohol dehydrogenase GroES-like domain-containing protein [Streptomyces sp. 2114.4]
MRALVVTAPGKGGSTAVTELPDPRPEPDEVVVRVTSCGLCGTDMHLLGGELPAAVYPLVRGRPARPEAERSVPVSSGAAPH